MQVTISGLSAKDRGQLERAGVEDLGATITEDDSLDHGQGDMGIFTIIVPVTVALTSVLKKWIESRTPTTKIVVGDRVFEYTGPGMSPEEAERFVRAVSPRE